MSQLRVKSPKGESMIPELSDQLDMLTIKEDNKGLWVRRWGKNCKVAVRSKVGVNKEPVKKPSREDLKIKFKKIIDKDKRSEKWINIPRKVKEVKRREKTLFKGDPPREWDIYYAFYKEQQMHDEKSEALVKARKENKRTYPLK
ncbi:hypothetical protein A2U01_0034465 [Trifolium medium]|uniref:Uncharacterized protein n=1 Tax=Trifolium medium TaxID=97028 RepID=A0A392PMP4_9FABA|nr:hypothetical protein [Trifolium medium]